MRPPQPPGCAGEPGWGELIRWLGVAALIAISAGLLGLYPLAFSAIVGVACLGAWRSARAACIAVAALSPIMAVGSLSVGFNLIPAYPVIIVGLLGLLRRREYRDFKWTEPDLFVATFGSMAVLVTLATYGNAPSGGVVAATGVNAPALRPFAQLGALLLMLGAYALFRIGAHEPSAYRAPLRALAASFCLVATYGAYQVIARLGDLPYAFINDRRLVEDLPPGQTYIRINSTLTEASPLSAFAILVLLLCLGALLGARRSDRPPVDARWAGLLALGAAGIVAAAMSKAAMLAFALATPILLTAGNLRIRARYLLGGMTAAAVAGLGLAATRYPDLLSAPQAALDSERYVRVGYWLAAIDVSASHPFGVGTGNLAFYYPAAAPVSEKYEFFARITDAHNWFIEAFAETGFIGGSAFVGFILSLIWFGIRSGRSKPPDEWGPSLTALVCAFVVFNVMHTTYSVFYYPFEWVVAGLIGAQIAAGRRARGAQASPLPREARP